LTRCRHCRILFFTHPRNSGRSDLGCPFGCREAHRKKESKLRSLEYYRSSAGKIKKKALNFRRKARSDRFDGKERSPGVKDTRIISHIQVVTSLIEERFVSMEYITGLIDKVLRQHSIDKRKKCFYTVENQVNAPP
jgi:hypothetical protein